MSDERPLKVVLCWHMHQPQYLDPESGSYQLPWTYLHAIKDYVDMAAHLEAVPGARAVVNFAPILLEQLAGYAEQIRAHLREGAPIHDPLLAALDSPVPPAGSEERLGLIRDCTRANRENLVERFPAFRRLVDMAEWLEEDPEALLYIDDQFIADLLTWYHLAWMGETVRREDPRIRGLQEKAAGFTVEDRRHLLSIIGELIESVPERYRRLAKNGQVELSVTPYAHPIVPLLLDFQSAREALPDSPLPEKDGYPGGSERARWHLREGIETFRRHFGLTPEGCWPSEGAVSAGTLRLLGELGFAWAATGEGVLGHSLGEAYGKYGADPATNLCYPYRIQQSETACFFRDDELSDLIGFQYSDWHADDAVEDLIYRLEGIAEATADHPEPLVPIILDGENAWEHYPENGYYFLSGLYSRLAEHPGIQLTTFRGALDGGVRANRLDRLVAGSWVYGTLSTWIGDKDKNRGWEMLVEAKEAYDRCVAEGRLDGDAVREATQQLATCEGSDWFWWFGDYNPAEVVRDFERLFRLHLSRLYRRLGETPPEYLAHSFAHGSGQPAHGGVMRPGRAAD
ncbi:glycoside hydrolase [Thiohalorhabdus denitrificans]|uniref:Alpha-amylase/alpha-mannosidase, GH57 family n=1 Tax=Thiohalorhabdus denitrificans TaxID=381306 RepID=A0A0P9C5E4_9GAMM|nr:glycoside hydrolase family 57 protein [Thiohalorhabdus denitrificans]KPV40074.1 glycoside hydrolase [Thiohalorhabdus denitrificans]SCY14635.1 Alpha-amylase/alpha-mannosidase, GH57 family [Thiohalorhabdus denitrificans]